MLDERLLFSNCILSGNQLWYVSNQGYLMYMDMSTGKVSYAGIENKDNWVKHSMSDPMFAHEGCLYWVDQFGMAVHEYCIRLKKYYLYELPATERLETCYAGIFMYAGKIYMFPKKTPGLIIFDLDKKEISVQSSLYEDFWARERKKKNLTLYYAVQNQNFVYVFLTDMETVWEVDVRNGKYRILRMKQKVQNISSVIYINNLMHILDLNGNVYTWNIENDEFFCIFECKTGGLSFSRMIATENKLFMLPNMSEKILIMNLKYKTVLEADNYPDDLQYREINWSKYWGYTENEQYVWFATRISNYMLVINKEKEKIEWKKMIPPTSREEYDFCKSVKRLQQKRMQQAVLQEREYGLPYLLCMISEKQGEKLEWGKGKGSVGKSIWQAIKK